MKKSDSPYLEDWIIISLRWLAIFGAMISIALQSQFSLPVIGLLMSLASWNAGLSLIAVTNRRFRWHRQISLTIDALFTILFFWLEGGAIFGPALWLIFLTLLTGAIYFDFKGGFGATIAMLVVEGSSIFFNRNLIEIGIGVLATLGLGLTFGYVSERMIAQLRAARKQRVINREKQNRMGNDRMRAIYDLTTTLTATLSYKRVLDSALDLSVNALHVDDAETEHATPKDDRLVSAVLLFKGDELLVGSARRFTTADMRATFPAKQGLLARVIEEGEPVLIGTVASDPELGRLVGLQGCKSIYCFPMRSGFNVYGALIFAHPLENYFTDDRCNVLAIIGRQAVIAIQNARLYQDVADEKERIVEVQEEARKKLARDLHDGPTQSVAALAMRVNLARRMIERDHVPDAVDELVKIEDLARRTSKEIRHMLFTLRPLVLESQGLAAALEAMAEKMKEMYEQNVIIQVDENLASQLEMGKTGVIFYIAEEAVNNARKHAQAAHIWVRLKPLPKQNDIAFLEIADDGLGFDVAEVNKTYDKRGSLGMVNLRERSELVNGILHIESAPGKGAKIQVFIPLTEDAADQLHHARDQGTQG